MYILYSKASTEEPATQAIGRVMPKFEYGIVKSFNPHVSKQVGFLRVLDEDGQVTDETVFFDYLDGQFVHLEEGEIDFGGCEKDGMRMWHPRVGEKLAFNRVPCKDSLDTARPWTYAEGYDNCVRKLTEPLYRVIQDIKFGYGNSLDSRKPIWEGQGGNAMATEYPIRVLDGELVDPLRQWVDHSAGSTTHYFFEMLVTPDMTDDTDCPPEGHWQPCQDPRPRSDMARELESAS